MLNSTRHRHGGTRLALGLMFGLSVSGCDGLLEVELPHLLTDAAIEGSTTAELQVNSAIALFECGYTGMGLMAMGHEDLMESVAGVFGGGHIFDASANTGVCDSSTQSFSWFDQISGARALLSNDPARLVSSGEGTATGVYDRIQDEWSLGATGEKLSAIAAIYVAASLAHMGEFICEIALDNSDMMSPSDALNLAETWTNTAIGHIAGAGGDFAMPFDIAPSATLMATAIRARIRWANGNLAGANTDATTVLTADPDFNAWVTRENGETRRNKIHLTNTAIGFSSQLGINTTWNPSARDPNPATGLPWPNPIPFTGYLFLGIMPDGRTLETATNTPVVWAEEIRDGAGAPVPTANGSVIDTRTPHHQKTIQGSVVADVPDRYSADDDDVPYMTWEELRLIQADYQLSQGNRAGAIATVNSIRADGSKTALPPISGAYMATLLASNDAVRAMLLEERRREFYAEGGRYWSTKIQNTDLLWFPRGQGITTNGFYQLDGGVRQHMPNNEFDRNPFFIAAGGRDARGTGCDPAQAPVRFN